MQRLASTVLLGAVSCLLVGCGGSGQPAPPDRSDMPAEARAEEEAREAAIKKNEEAIQKRMEKKR